MPHLSNTASTAVTAITWSPYKEKGHSNSFTLAFKSSRGLPVTRCRSEYERLTILTASFAAIGACAKCTERDVTLVVYDNIDVRGEEYIRECSLRHERARDERSAFGLLELGHSSRGTRVILNTRPLSDAIRDASFRRECQGCEDDRAKCTKPPGGNGEGTLERYGGLEDRATSFQKTRVSFSR